MKTHNLRAIISVIALMVGILAGSAGAATVTTTDAVVDCSAADLLQTSALTNTAFTGTFTAESCLGVPSFVNGVACTATGASPNYQSNRATDAARAENNTTVTYTLNAGYTLTQIDIYHGWQDDGRDRGQVTVKYAEPGDEGTFTTIVTAQIYDPASSYGRIRLTDLDILNAKVIRFEFPATQENNAAGYSEIDVFGSLFTGAQVGPGSDIGDAVDQDTPGLERLNVDRTSFNLPAGTYDVDDFRLNVHTHTTGGTVTPMLLSGTPPNYTTLWVGSAFDPTSNGDQTVPESGSFTLGAATDVYAGYFSAGAGAGIMALDANNSDPGNSSTTDHDANGYTAPTGPGQAVNGFSHTLGRTYAFEINVSVPTASEEAIAVSDLAAADITFGSATLSATLEAAATNADVYAYWGTTDGSNNPANWTGSAYVGSWTNVASTNVSYAVSGLSDDTSYYYTFSASNATEQVFVSPSATFSTLGPFTATGGNTTNDINGYRIHTFTGNGTLTVTGSRDVEVLVVAGGGGAGANGGGGGGAGGLVYSNAYTVSSSQSVTIGGGGTGSSAGTVRGTSGANSSFGSLTATGGGGGASRDGGGAALSGGSGGGGGGGGPSAAGSASPAGQGENGGNGINSGANSAGGGGGGAGAVGSAAASQNGGDGGDGLTYSISGSAVTYAGGGGGGNTVLPGTVGTGGSGGGGDGASGSVTHAGIANTGGGGGGGSGGTGGAAGGNGGTGIVIVRYLLTSDELSISGPSASSIATDSATLNATLLAASTNADVYAYWGTSDGSNTPANWTESAYVGSWTNESIVNVSHPVSSLASSTLYYYTFNASNDATNIWISPSASFSTHDTPEVDNAGGVTNIGVGTADLQGRVVAINGVPLTHVRIYFGDNDGGATHSWDTTYTFDAGSVTQGVVFTESVSDLLYGRTYSYRTYASNVYGEVWSSVSSFTTVIPPVREFSIDNFASASDADTGIESSITYTHRVDINNNGATLINGVSFDNTGSYTLAGATTSFGDGDGYTGVGILEMTDDFLYGGNPATLTVSGLTPGTPYKLRIYINGWAGSLQDFAFDDTSPSTVVTDVNRGTSSGFPASIDYTYVLGAGDTDLQVTVTPQSPGNTFHFMGFSNEEVPPVAIANTAAANVTAAEADLVGTLDATGSVFTVTAYVSTNNNANSAAWLADADATNVVAGTFMDIMGLSVTGSVAALTSETTYYYTLLASNDATNLWASPNVMFTTLASGTAPVADLGGGAIPGSGATAALRGELTAGGSANAYFVWGESDGGIVSTGNWDNVVSLGVVGESAVFTNILSDLLFGIEYDYRVYVTNGITEDWSGLGAFTTLQPQPGAPGVQISYAVITGDADSGISTNSTYTHALDFGNGTAATVNGVVFSQNMGVAAGAQSNPGTRTYGGGFASGTPPGISGNIASVFTDFRHGGPDLGYIELTGLTAGQWYDVRTYERAWDYNSTLRTFYLDYDVGGDAVVEYTTFPNKIDQNRPTLTPPGLAGNVSWTISHVYQADSSGKMRVVIDLAPDNAGSYHLYGLTNEELDALPPVVGIDNTAAANITATTADLVGTLDATQSVFDVTVYWSTNNNADSAAWLADGDASSAVIDTYTNVSGQTVSASVGSLTGATTYYYTMLASNPLTNFWATPNATFASQGAPTVTTDSGASGQDVGTATLNGLLTDGGVADATIVWGETDGGTLSTSNWTYAESMGAISQGVGFSTNLSGLYYGIEYDYAVYATNAGGEDWSAVSTFKPLVPRRIDPLISYHAITDDADSGISNSKTYTHAVDFGNDSPRALINGVQFQVGSGGTFGTAVGTAATIGTGSTTISASHGGNSSAAPYLNGAGAAAMEALVEDMNFNTVNATISLTGLIPGQHYRFRLYNRSWAGVASREQNIGFDTDGVGTDINGAEDTATFNADDATDSDPGYGTFSQVYALTYDYVLPLGQTTLKVYVNATGAGSYHMYGLTNEELPVEAATVDLSVSNTAAANITDTSADLQGTLESTQSVFDVTAYWSTNDNADAAAWLADGDASSASGGSYTNVTGQPISVAAGSLTFGTTYYYTLRATNPETNLWASPNATFESVGGPEATTSGGATDLAIGTATLNGILTGGALADAFLCWGANDGGTGSTGAWDYVASIGAVTQDVAFSQSVADLLYGIEYEYRVFVTNAFGTDWSGVATFSTLSPGGAPSLALSNPGFELPDYGAGGFEYFSTMDAGELSAAVWTYTGGAGFSGPNGPWKCNTTSPDTYGDQFAYLQGAASVSQVLTGLTAGASYNFSFYESYRTGTASGNDLNVILDEGLGTEMTLYNNGNVNNATWEARQTATFVATKTSYTLTFRATHPIGSGDRTTIVDGVVPTTVLPPFGITNTVASNIGIHGADVGGSLNATQSVFNVSVYWSTIDNANSAAWLADGTASSAAVGSFTNVMGQSLLGTTGWLDAEQTYYYTMMGLNEVGDIWATPNGSFTTLPATMVFRFK